MKACTHCGDTFQPSFSAAKLCLRCWKKRENALMEYDDLKARIDKLETEAALREWEDEPDEAVSADRIKQLLRLCHPDRHHDTPRETTATEVTQWLNQIKKNA